jgi:hypothetical protein
MRSEHLRRKHECELVQTVPDFSIFSKPRVFGVRILCNFSCKKSDTENLMSCKISGVSRVVFATALAGFTMLAAGSAFASQGPGGGLGSAGALTQLTMAIIVYGASAAIVGAGLIGAMRGR